MFSTEPLPFNLAGQNGVETWRGYLSDVRLFDHSLTAGEIAELSGNAVMGIAGDYNNNGQVEQGDLDFVLLNWGADVSTLPDTWTNQRPTEGIVDQVELDGVLLNWGSVAALGGAAGVPEPASAVLLLIAAAFGHWFLRRR